MAGQENKAPMVPAERFDITRMDTFSSEVQFKKILADHYLRSIENFFGNEKQALAFMSAVSAAVQRIPDLLKCTPISVVNSFMMMAQLGFMPSNVSGEAYVLPYENSKKDPVTGQWYKVKEAQFQMGYQGIVTLLYRAGAREIITALVREHDKFALSRGKVTHEVDPRKSKSERGAWIGVYAIIELKTGGTIEEYMTKEDVIAHAKRYSKSFDSKHTPWDEENDREGWMPRKTVLKQAAKLAPKNETLNIALAEDNKDSNISDRLPGATDLSRSLTMGALATGHGKTEEERNAEAQARAGEESQDGSTDAEGSQEESGGGESVIQA